MSALLIYPTHENCRETCAKYQSDGVPAACYPARRTDPEDGEPVNCWNPDADQAEAMGLVVLAAVCPECSDRGRCQARGYLYEQRQAEKAPVTFATHARATFGGLASLGSGRAYISIHENPIAILRPKFEISEADLRSVQSVLHPIVHSQIFVKYFKSATGADGEGSDDVDEDTARKRKEQFDFCCHLLDLIDGLLHAVQAAEKSQEWQPLTCLPRPEGIQLLLFFATRIKAVKFGGQPWRFVLAAGAGEIDSAAILVNQWNPRGPKEPPVISKQVVGFANNRPPKKSAVWFNDATIELDRLQSILGFPVQNLTPQGHVPLRKKAVQVLRDFTRGNEKQTVLKYIRGALADRPQSQRIGIICHQPHRKAIDELEPEYAGRIVKVAHFGSGEDRSSNAWSSNCDLVLVVGTPRVPPPVIASYLFQIGEVAAATHEPAWGRVVWEGRNEAGELIRVNSSGYLDESWRRGHRDLVRAALVQAIGRGRGILESGCEVLLLSNEECGLVISDGKLEPLNQTEQCLLENLRRLSLENANNILGISSVSTAILARAVGICDSQARFLLGSLDARGLVRKKGERGGWLPIAPAEAQAGRRVRRGGVPPGDLAGLRFLCAAEGIERMRLTFDLGEGLVSP